MNALGLIFANIYDSSLGQLTNKRTMASLPFGGRYRQIDFPLSNMSSAGITRLGLITKHNYQSLINHIGSGQEWDLNLGAGGLEFLTPYAQGHNASYRGKLEAITSAIDFIEMGSEEYVILSDSNVLCMIDYDKVLQAHIKSGCDVTVMVKAGIANGKKVIDLAVKTDKKGRVSDMAVDYIADESYLASMGMFIMKRELLMRAAKECVAHSRYHLERDFILRACESGTISVNVYEFEGVAMFVESMQEYYQHNLALLDPEVRHRMFRGERMVYTSVHHAVPAYLGDNAQIGNCIIGDGCSIEGSVDQSVLFREVRVGIGAKLKGCIAMQGCSVGDGAHLECVILDRNVVVRPGAMLIGTPEHPIVVSGGDTV